MVSIPVPAVDHAFGPPGAEEDPLLSILAGVALVAAGGAARIAADGFGGEREQVETKSSATDMVSEVDRAAEAHIAWVLHELRPEDGVLGEEGTNREGSTGVCWVVDPLDGTTNYLFGVPAWSVSVAAEVDGRPVVGIVIDPSREQTWAAVEGRGARMNGTRVRVAEGRSSLATALVSTGFNYSAQARQRQADVVRHLIGQVRDIRRFGSAALDLCWVAGGLTDAFYEWGLNPWDVAAGTLVCREAGGVVARYDDGLVVATTPSLAGPLGQLLDSAAAAADASLTDGNP